MEQAFLSYFVINVAIILFNRRRLVTFSWRNLFCLVKSNIYIYIYIFFFLLYFMCIFCLLIFLMHIFFFCTASAFSRTTEHTAMCLMLQTARPFRKCWSRNKWSEEVIARHSSVCGPWGGQRVCLSQLFSPRTQAELGLYLMLSGNKFWFYLVPR